MKEVIKDNRMLIIGGLVMMILLVMMMFVLLVSGCLTPGQYLDQGLSGAANLTGNIINWTSEAVRG